MAKPYLVLTNFGDLITADHKVFSDNSKSRNNHRYAVVVQDLATQWIQAYPCKNKTSQETQRSLQKFLEPERKPTSFTLTIPWNSAKPSKISPGIIARRHHTDRKQMGLLREQSSAQSKRRQALHHKFRIDTGRTKFGQGKTDRILYSRGFL